NAAGHARIARADPAEQSCAGEVAPQTRLRLADPLQHLAIVQDTEAAQHRPVPPALRVVQWHAVELPRDPLEERRRDFNLLQKALAGETQEYVRTAAE